MKTLALAVLVVALVVPNALATCPTAPSGPFWSGGHSWFDWSPDPACLSTNNMNGSTLSCYSFGAYSPTLQQPSWVRYSFTADQNYSTWSADAFVDFDDPNNSSSNWVDAWAYVNHNGVNSSYHLFYHDGSIGDLGCARPGGTFSAVDGDSVTIEFSSYRNNSNTTIKIGYPNIFDTN
jgi:hypothetical protein